LDQLRINVELNVNFIGVLEIWHLLKI